MTDPQTDDLMTIRAMCDAFAVTARTLRFYESKELITPQRDGARRLYTRRDRARLTLILRGKRFGFSLEDIRQLLDMYEPQSGNAAQMIRIYDLAAERLAAMESQAAELAAAIADLKSQLAASAQGIDALRRAAPPTR